MKNFSQTGFIKIDFYSATPKYLQLANGILRAIQKGFLKQGEMVPSINEISFECEISRDTVEKSFKYLKTEGVLGSVPGKGFFVKKTDLEQNFHLLLLFNKLSSHKKIVYDSFIKALGSRASVDLYIYNNDFLLFKKILDRARKDYTHYVILPHFTENEQKAYEIINTLPKDKLILVDHFIDDIEGDFGVVFEKFEEDIFQALEEASDRLKQYKLLKLVFPADTYYPKKIVEGFKKFCRQYAYEHKVISRLNNEPLKEGDVYIVIPENDLVALVEKILCTRLKVGKNIGIISYNETSLKKVVLQGITTISTDFESMGAKTAKLILQNSKERFRLPFTLTLRKSL